MVIASNYFHNKNPVSSIAYMDIVINWFLSKPPITHVNSIQQVLKNML